MGPQKLISLGSRALRQLNPQGLSSVKPCLVSLQFAQICCFLLQCQLLPNKINISHTKNFILSFCYCCWARRHSQQMHLWCRQLPDTAVVAQNARILLWWCGQWTKIICPLHL